MIETYIVYAYWLLTILPFPVYVYWMRTKMPPGIAVAEGLTQDERMTVWVLSILNPIWSQLSFYYGLKWKAPLKAKQANKIGWLALLVWLPIVIVLFAIPMYRAASQAYEDTQPAPEQQIVEQTVTEKKLYVAKASSIGFEYPAAWQDGFTPELRADDDSLIALFYLPTSDPTYVSSVSLHKLSSGRTVDEYADILRDSARARGETIERDVLQGGEYNLFTSVLVPATPDRPAFYEMRYTFVTPNDTSSILQFSMIHHETYFEEDYMLFSETVLKSLVGKIPAEVQSTHPGI